MLAQLGKGGHDTMRDLSDMGMRVIVAILVGAGLVGLASVASRLLPPGGLPDAAGGWPLLAALAALLCGVCALAMSLTLRWRWRHARKLFITGLMASALAWGAVLAAASAHAWWAQALGWPWLAETRPELVAVGAALPAWLVIFAALAGLLAGQRQQTSAIWSALTPLWLAPLWGASVGLVFGLLFALVFYSPPCPPGYHCYGLDMGPWDGLRTGLPLGLGAGLIVGLALALALWLALTLRPDSAYQETPSVGARSAEA